MLLASRTFILEVPSYSSTRSLVRYFEFRKQDKAVDKTLLIVGQDATETFYSLHRHEVLDKPQYQRLVIGTIKDEKPQIFSRIPGALSTVPYAEPTWLTAGYYSPYFKEVSETRPISTLQLTFRSDPEPQTPTKGYA